MVCTWTSHRDAQLAADVNSNICAQHANKSVKGRMVKGFRMRLCFLILPQIFRLLVSGVGGCPATVDFEVTRAISTPASRHYPVSYPTDRTKSINAPPTDHKKGDKRNAKEV